MKKVSLLLCVAILLTIFTLPINVVAEEAVSEDDYRITFTDLAGYSRSNGRILHDGISVLTYKGEVVEVSKEKGFSKVYNLSTNRYSISTDKGVTVSSDNLVRTHLDINDCVMDETYINDQIYTGKPLTPKIQGLSVNEENYKVFYTNNTEVGIATAKVVGIGEYTGSRTYTFNILEPEPTEPEPIAVTIETEHSYENDSITIKPDTQVVFRLYSGLFNQIGSYRSGYFYLYDSQDVLLDSGYATTDHKSGYDYEFTDEGTYRLECNWMMPDYGGVQYINCSASYKIIVDSNASEEDTVPTPQQQSKTIDIGIISSVHIQRGTNLTATVNYLTGEAQGAAFIEKDFTLKNSSGSVLKKVQKTRGSFSYIFSSNGRYTLEYSYMPYDDSWSSMGGGRSGSVSILVSTSGPVEEGNTTETIDTTPIFSGGRYVYLPPTGNLTGKDVYESSDTSVAVVDEKGTVCIINNGVVDITVTNSDKPDDEPIVYTFVFDDREVFDISDTSVYNHGSIQCYYPESDTFLVAANGLRLYEGLDYIATRHIEGDKMVVAVTGINSFKGTITNVFDKDTGCLYYCDSHTVNNGYCSNCYQTPQGESYEIIVDDLDRPVAGKTPDNTCIIKNNNYTIKNIQWNTNEAFKDAEQYTVTLTLKANGAKVIPEKMLAVVAGEQAEITKTNDNVIVKCTFTTVSDTNSYTHISKDGDKEVQSIYAEVGKPFKIAILTKNTDLNRIICNGEYVSYNDLINKSAYVYDSKTQSYKLMNYCLYDVVLDKAGNYVFEVRLYSYFVDYYVFVRESAHEPEAEYNIVAPGLEYTKFSDYVYIDGYSGNASNLRIPDNIGGLPVEYIGVSAFEDCDTLKSVTIGRNVTKISGNPFAGCDNLEEIKVDEYNPYYDSRNNCNAIIDTVENVLISGCKNTMIPDGIKEIGSSAFSGCKALENIEIPNSITKIGGYAFKDCTSLERISIPDSVESLGTVGTFTNLGVFNNCSNLKVISIGNCQNALNENNYWDCSSLQHVYFSGSEEDWEANYNYSWISGRQLSNAVRHYNSSDESLKLVKSVEPDATSEGYNMYQCLICKELITMRYTDGSPEIDMEPSTGKPEVPSQPIDSSEPSDFTKPSYPAEDNAIMGDVNGDNKVNIKDATHIQKVAAKLVELTDAELIRADVNVDSKVNVKDATAIQKYVAKIETGLPIGEKIQ